MIDCENRCTGDCCRVFIFTESPQQLKDRASITDDDRKISEMVIPMMMPTATGLGRQYHQYTCRHYWNGRCEIYEERPYACRYHADDSQGSICENIGCSLVDVCNDGPSCRDHSHERTFSDAMQNSRIIRYSMFAWSKLLRTLVRYGVMK